MKTPYPTVAECAKEELKGLPLWAPLRPRARAASDPVLPSTKGAFREGDTFLRGYKGESHPCHFEWGQSAFRVFRLCEPLLAPHYGPPKQPSKTLPWLEDLQGDQQVLGWKGASFKFGCAESMELAMGHAGGDPSLSLISLLEPYTRGLVSWSDAEALVRRVWRRVLLPETPALRGGTKKEFWSCLTKVVEHHERWFLHHVGSPPERRFPAIARSDGWGWGQSSPYIDQEHWLHCSNRLPPFTRERSLAHLLGGNPNHSWSVGGARAWVDNWMTLLRNPSTFRLWDPEEGEGGGGWRPLNIRMHTHYWGVREATMIERWASEEGLFWKGKLILQETGALRTYQDHGVEYKRRVVIPWVRFGADL